MAVHPRYDSLRRLVSRAPRHSDSVNLSLRRDTSFLVRAALPFLVAALPLRGIAGETPTAPFPHQILDRVLKEHVADTGEVDYRALQLQQHDLAAYVDSLALVSPKSHGSRFSGTGDRLAYWINAYNGLVLKGVVAAYPVASVMAIVTEGWFFREQKFVVGGVEMTLDHLENRIIRPEFRDARIHFAINCAAASCPRLENRAFDGPTLEQRLEAATKRFSRTASHVRIDRDARIVYLSKIMEWFARDFQADSSAPNQNGHGALSPQLRFLLPYLRPSDAEYLRGNPDIAVTFVEYDWALNDRVYPDPEPDRDSGAN